MPTKGLIQQMVSQQLRNVLRPILSHTLYPVGAVRTILLGPSRGLRYRIFPDYGLAPIFGGWEPNFQQLVQKIIKPSNTVYDIGANYGIHTLLLARTVGGHGRVYAFEPNHLIFRQLRENLAVNRLNQAIPVPIAVTNRAGVATYILGHHAGAGHLQSNQTDKGMMLTVPVTSIDTMVFQHGFRPPHVIKVDVEGAESKVLSGAMQTLKIHRPILIVELHTPAEDVAVGRILIETSYQAYRIETGERITDLSRGWPHPDGLWGQFVAYPQAD